MGFLPTSAKPSTATSPSQTSSVTYGDKTYDIVKEGSAEILKLKRPAEVKTKISESSQAQSVFYNPIQQYNRDLSVLAIKAFGEDWAAVRRIKQRKNADRSARAEQRGRQKKSAGDGSSKEDSKLRTNETTRALSTEKEDHSNLKENPGTVSTASVLIEEESQPKEKRKLEGDDRALVAEEGHPKKKKQEDAPAVGALDEQKNKRKREEDDRDDAPSAKKRNTDISPNPLFDRPSRETSADVIVDQGFHEKRQVHKEEEDIAGKTKSPFRILDALSATGLRALRYAKEIPMVTSITANDLSHSATTSITLNVQHNQVSEKINVTTGDAVDHMHRTRSKRCQYQVIDLDPYGTSAPFLDAAVQAVVDGGLLCVTCTDAGVFASVGYLEKTYSQYGGLPLKGPHAHEGGLRLILHSIATSAARYGYAIEPLLSLSIDFYARIFVRIHHSPMQVKFLASKTMVVYSCDHGCGAWKTQFLAKARERKARNGDVFHTFKSALGPSANPHCEHCDFKTHQAGPMWGGPLHNPHFVQHTLDILPSLNNDIYGTIPRIEGMLSLALNESLDVPDTSLDSARPIPPLNPASRATHPFFFVPNVLTKIMHTTCPPDAAVRGALLHLGYRTTRSHTKAGSICTDAPWDVIWEIMREWIRQKSQVKKGAHKPGTPGWGIMQKDRSKMEFMQIKKELRNAIDNPTVTDSEDLKREVEAALYRIGKTKDIDAGSLKNGGNDHEGHEQDGEAHDMPPSKLNIVFDEELGKEPQRRTVRYQANPRPDWGPMNRAVSDIRPVRDPKGTQ